MCVQLAVNNTVVFVIISIKKIQSKQEVHGPHCSPEKPVSTMKTFMKSYDYICHELGPVVLKKIFKKFCQYIFTLSLLSPLGNKQVPSFEQT